MAEAQVHSGVTYASTPTKDDVFVKILYEISLLFKWFVQLDSQ